MRWPKPDELQRWTPYDQVVFLNGGGVLSYSTVPFSAYWLSFPRSLSARMDLHGPM